MENVRFILGEINKSIPVPLYYQIKQMLLTAIKDGRLSQGDILPTELEFCAQCEVSRPTIRQALSELVAEGYLYRLKGKGTFVSSPKIAARFLNKLQSFNEEMEQKGLKPSTCVLSFQMVPGRSLVNEKLMLPASSQLFYLERLRFADGEPLVYLETFVPYIQFKALEGVDFVSESLYQSMEEKCGTHVVRVQREIEAVSAGQREAALLDIPKNSALMLVRTVAFTEQGSPAEFSVARYRGDRNKFGVELQR